MIKSDSITLALSGVMLLVIMIGIIESTMGTASATTGSVNKVQSGLVSSDSFTTGNTSGWTFGGTATLYNSYEDSQGLHFGVQSPNSGQWVNHYAAAAKANAHLFHAGLTIPYASVADGVFNPGLYVEGSNYAGIVGCQAYADHTGYYWIVQYSTNAGSTWNTLYAPPRDSLPQTEDCTVMTSGSNYLDVYIGGKVVFSSTTMSLNMPTPLHAFVQADTSSSSMDYTTYSNYYSTTDENIKVTNNTSNAATVQIVGTTGNVLATAPVSAGTATLNVGMYTFPLSGTINVYDSNNSIIASSPASIYGGDVFSVTSPSVTPTTPQPPTGLTATAVSTSQINLSWNASSVTNLLVTGYKIERSTDSGTTWSTIVSNTGSTSTTYSDTGLAASTTYTYRVSAIYLGVGTSSPSNTASATTQAPPATAPGSPTGLTATTISSSQINLSWTAPSSNGGSAITGYKIERSQDAGTTWSIISSNTASTGTTYSDAGLAASTTYTYRVSAINSVGTSSPSNTASATTSATAPGSPTGLTATTVSSSQINLSWTASTSNGGSAITGYKIERSTDSGTTWSTIVPNTGSTSTTYSDTGLAQNTSYTYRVSAINSVGISSPSNTASATTSTTATAPGSPTGLTATTISSSQIHLSWTAPSNNGGSAITSYKIERSTDGITFTVIAANTASTSTTYSDTGLAASTTYTYRVSAINSVGTSSPSNTSSATTSSSTGTTQVIISVKSVDLSGTPINGMSVVIRYTNGTTISDTFTPASFTVTSGTTYIVHARNYGTNVFNHWQDGTTNSYYTITPTQSVTLTAYYSTGTVTSTVPSAPQNLQATGGNAQVSLSWTAPSNNGGSAITGYEVERSKGSLSFGGFSNSTNTTFFSAPNATAFTDNGLSASTTYNYTVFAKNSIGSSYHSNTASATTFSVSQPPTGLTATAASTSQINLSWTAPANNGGSAITGYKIDRSNNTGTTWSTVVFNTASTGTTYSDTGLNPSTSYTYRISAINSIGTSSPSNTASATTNQPSLTLTKSGLLISDSLSNETATQQQLQTNSKYWIYGGDAIAEKAPYTFWRNTQGLHIGVQAPSNGTWAGVYSVSRNTPAMLFHSVITTPVQTIPKNNVYYNNGMYVQTNGSNNVNYVTCASNISSFGTVWAVFWATGNPFGATNFTRLWYDPSLNQPLTRDCTVITNGNNYLKVYLDGIKVVDSNKMNLLMPPPFNVFLEPQSSYAGQLLNGTFTDYYASTSENVTVTNLPSNAVRVDIVDSSGNVLATSQVANQIANLNVGQYHFPLSGTIKVYDSNNALITSRPSSIYGGDVYSVNP